MVRHSASAAIHHPAPGEGNVAFKGATFGSVHISAKPEILEHDTGLSDRSRQWVAAHGMKDDSVEFQQILFDRDVLLNMSSR